MKFLIDNQLPVHLAVWLRNRGADAIHVLERGQARTDDRVIWEEALAEDRILVSKDGRETREFFEVRRSFRQSW